MQSAVQSSLYSSNQNQVRRAYEDENVNRMNFNPKAGLVTNLICNSPTGLKAKKLLPSVIDRSRIDSEPSGTMLPSGLIKCEDCGRSFNQ
jgi:hypothetical protein